MPEISDLNGDQARKKSTESLDCRMRSLKELTCVLGDDIEGIPSDIMKRNGQEYEEVLQEIQRQLVQDLVVGENCLKSQMQKKVAFKRR